VEALLSGQIDAGLLETTDARLSDAAVELVEDDRGLQPHESVVPMAAPPLPAGHGWSE
jgi:osmoprotectant transport system substrate-binding protein